MNPATALARTVVQALVGAGIRRVVLCPGSRSAPLAYELHRRDPGTGRHCPEGPGPHLNIRHDERVAAFVALGIGRAGTGTGAVVTTSGTAVANLHPAVLEAHHSNVPLVVITADRPDLLRGTWANQTTDLQAGLFGPAVRARIDLEDAAASADPAGSVRALARVLRAARGTPGGARPGPVHLNLGFTMPLLPDTVPGVPGGVPGTTHPQGGPGTADGGSGVRELLDLTGTGPVPPGGALTAPDPLDLLEGAGPRTVVVAGDGAGPWGALLARRFGLPLLAEPSSGSRTGPNAVGPYRLLLDVPALGGGIERVVVLGRPTLSRPVTRLFEDPGVEVVLVTEHPQWPEPGREARRVPLASLEPVLRDAPPPADGWLLAWREAGAVATDAVDAVLDGVEGLTGPLVAREVAAATGPGQRLMVSASNPVRDLDLVMRPVPQPAAPSVLANRGLAGIDGILSTASGLTLAPGADPVAPVRVLVGDLAFLHDLNALWTGPDEPPVRLQVVVVNDRGGGIFSLLEHGERALGSPDRARTFERVFGTPHSADLSALCAGYGAAHREVTDLAGLRLALREPRGGIDVVEIRTHRSDLRELHRRIRSEVTARIGPVIVP